MKNIYYFLLVTFALFAFVPVTNALDDDPPYKEKNHIAYSKYPTGPEDGIYTIHLETFVTGEKTVTVSSLPADVVLVLDVSGSMEDPYTSYKFTARASTGYTYDNYPGNNNNRYWYKHTDGNYYVVTRNYYTTGSWWSSTYHYYLQVNIGGTNYYLSGNQITGTMPSEVTSSTATIWTGVLYTRQAINTTRIAALKDAVKDFIDVIAESDPGEAGKHNQISIVKFAGKYNGAATSSEETGNNRYTEDGYSYNYTEIVKGFTEVYDETTAENLKTYVTALNEGGATSSDYGMNKALALINTLYANNGQGAPLRQSNKTVVFFTDGVPTHARRYDETVAVNAIKAAQTIKGKIAYHDDKKNEDVYVSVYSVGVFGSMNGTGMTETQRDTYMHRISSDYPNASGMGSTQGGTGGSDSAGYYQNASNTDLSSIFRTIASEAGGSHAQTVTAEATTTVDVVAQSFDLPYGSNVDSIKVYFADCTGFENGYLTFDEEHKKSNPAVGVDGHVTIQIDTITQKITATGFDYSGNWCGKDESLGENQYHGMKMMIEIPIEMSDDAVGGNQVGTNGPASGIYVNGENLCPFDIPHIDLPINLHIQKEIADGECATFEIYRKKLEDGATWETKPFKTVIVIGGNNENKVKLMGLDPHYLYKIVEAGWSWTYDLEKVTDKDGNTIEGDITSDKLELNPFIFVNKKKDRQIRHAESAVYNDFRTAGEVEGFDSKPTSTSNENTTD